MFGALLVARSNVDAASSAASGAHLPYSCSLCTLLGQHSWAQDPEGQERYTEEERGSEDKDTLSTDTGFLFLQEGQSLPQSLVSEGTYRENVCPEQKVIPKGPGGKVTARASVGQEEGHRAGGGHRQGKVLIALGSQRPEIRLYGSLLVRFW